MSDTIQGNCWHCRHALTVADYGRETSCPGCGKPTRVCRNCGHYAPARPNECAEPTVERVLEKERANFCELFEPTDSPIGAGADAPADDLVRAAENLFK